MSFRLWASGLVALAPLAVLSTLVAPVACSSKATLGGQGASCNVVTDCQDGLICITPKNATTGSCSSNVGSVQQLPPIPDSGAAQAATDAAETDDSPGIVIPEDTGAPKSSLDAAGD